MLKIKDNVDLEKLVKKLDKKYKFEEVYECDIYYLLITEKYTYRDKDWKGRRYTTTEDFSWQIWKNDRHIRYLGYTKPNVNFIGYSMDEEFDFIYDLIKDDLIEKGEIKGDD